MAELQHQSLREINCQKRNFSSVHKFNTISDKEYHKLHSTTSSIVKKDSNSPLLKKKDKETIENYYANDDIINLVHVNDDKKTNKPNNTEKLLNKIRNLDTYAESLLYVNRIYNKVYGFERRRVPAHMPFLLDRTIITKMQDKFYSEFQKTSSHRVRDSEDMQLAFSYYYFLISEKQNVHPKEIFEKFDTDHSK